jgi:hypothetical protein
MTLIRISVTQGVTVVLTYGKLTGIYFLHLHSAIYFSVTTHRRKGKKLTILPPGDVNPVSVPSRRGLLEDSPYHAVGVACLSCEESRPLTYGMWRHWNVLWPLSQDVNTFL